ncbi:TetR/AcrR family transcriptional regulator [Galbibacter mesophilus]|uniref:TetR/AcrR family transcriptional regulator n=1 Tax=Galbibacter mesophilus TaxID=379069 RepID=UPI00191E0808|nr:TetR/AcrR family transcriptional regulator [Galbibacter mesophilus]MCM5663458.1 TetR/AcrR family transcriptional regulator [Galbibacter mesophilus]
MARKREFNETEVLEIAKDLFWKKGYNAVSTQDLISAFGISKSSMYGAFKDKKSLFILTLRHYIENTSAKMIAILEQSTCFFPTMENILNQLIQENLGDADSKGCFIVNTAIELAPHDTEILKLVQQNRTNIISAITKAIQKGMDTGELSASNNPEALAHYFYTLISGLRVEGKVTKDAASYQDTLQIALSAIAVSS